MEYKNLQTEITGIDDRTVTALFSVAGHIDDGDDRMMLGAFSKTLGERMDRVKVLWQHDITAPPIGVPVEVREVSRDQLPSSYLAKFPDALGGLVGKVRYLDTPRGNEVLVGIRDGAINENSIGFDPIKFDFDMLDLGGSKRKVRNLRECRLWDISPVNWGMNDAARVLFKNRKAMEFKDTGVVDAETAWATPLLTDFTEKAWADLDDAEKLRIAEHFAWSSKAIPDNFEDLQFPHHVASKSGIGKTVWFGVEAAMQSLMGINGKVDLGQDLQGVYKHLEKHYEQFGKESPSLNVVEFTALTGLLTLDEFKVGRVLSERNAKRLKDAISVLTQVLLEAEPQVDEVELLDTPMVETDSGLLVPEEKSNDEIITTTAALTSSRSRLQLEIAIRERGL